MIFSTERRWHDVNPPSAVHLYTVPFPFRNINTTIWFCSSNWWYNPAMTGCSHKITLYFATRPDVRGKSKVWVCANPTDLRPSEPTRFCFTECELPSRNQTRVEEPSIWNRSPATGWVHSRSKMKCWWRRRMSFSTFSTEDLPLAKMNGRIAFSLTKQE